MSKKFEMNMICSDGEERKKEFLIKKHPDKFMFYREKQRFMLNQQDPFGALLVLVNATFEKCVTGIDIDGFTDEKFSAKVQEFFINDPEALDILAGEVINFQIPSIKRN